MTLELLSAFFVYAFVGGITPGPNNMMVMSSGLNYGLKRTLPHIMGVTIGFGFMVFAIGIGLLSILDYFPIIYDALQVVCLVYLIYLAWKIATAKPLNNGDSSHSKPLSFMQAAIFQWVNPKALVMATAGVATYVPETPGFGFFINVVIISILYGLISFPCLMIWTAFGVQFKRFLKVDLYYRVFNVTMAILLLLSLYPLYLELYKGMIHG